MTGVQTCALPILQAEKLQRQTETSETWVRLQAPPGIGAVRTFSGRHFNVGSDRTVEMSAEDANYLIPYGWTKLAERKSDQAG